MDDGATLGGSFVRALAAKDYERILDLLHPEVDFRGLTPNRSWEASDRDAVVSTVLHKWFEDSDEIEGLERLETDGFADCERIGYRFSVRNPEGRFLVEQQAYIGPRDGRIVDAGALLGLPPPARRLTCDLLVTYSLAHGRRVQGPRGPDAPQPARRAVRARTARR